jgi:hypothetical protein
MLEQLLERIAAALETISSLQEKDLAVHGEMAGMYREYMSGRGAKSDSVPAADTHTAVSSAVAESNAVDDRKAREEEYEKLKAELTKRGVEIPPRTKLTTLQKLWEQHKDTPVAATAEVIEPELPEMPPAEPESTQVEVDPFDIPAAPAEETRDYGKMTADEARAIIMENYASTDEDKALLVAALASVKAPNWLAVPEGKHGEVAKAYLSAKGVAL